MKREVKNCKREELFNHFNSRTNPFIFVTTKIDITNLYNFCQKNKHYYATIGYFLTKAMNEIEEFKYTYKDGKIYLSDTIHPAFTEMKEDKTVVFFTCKYSESYEEFIEGFDNTKKSCLEGTYKREKLDDASVWLSVEPWFTFTGIVPPFDKTVIVPQMIWDKFQFENNRCYIDLMIMFHHGFVDGYHIGQLIEKINEVINDLPKLEIENNRKLKI